jgi:transposase InsO family protein
MRRSHRGGHGTGKGTGYYAWQRRAPSARAQRNAELTMKIHTIHIESRGTYGAPRIHAELAAQGIHVGRKREGSRTFAFSVLR